MRMNAMRRLYNSMLSNDGGGSGSDFIKQLEAGAGEKMLDLRRTYNALQGGAAGPMSLSERQRLADEAGGIVRSPIGSERQELAEEAASPAPAGAAAGAAAGADAKTPNQATTTTDPSKTDKPRSFKEVREAEEKRDFSVLLNFSLLFGEKQGIPAILSRVKTNEETIEKLEEIANIILTFSGWLQTKPEIQSKLSKAKTPEAVMNVFNELQEQYIDDSRPADPRRVSL